MKINNTKFLKKLIYPLIILTFLIAIISISSIYFFQYKHINYMSKDSSDKIISSFNRTFKKDIQTYELLIKLISLDKKAISLFLKKDREGLFNYYENTYKEFKNKLNISHFYFHNTNKINFLRMHNKNNYNDKINRITLNNSILNEDLGSGIEFGIFHNLTLRVVYPWIVDGKIIAYIELGKEIDYFTPELAKNKNAEVIFTINKSVISLNDYNAWLKKSKNNINFKELENFYIVDSSTQNLSIELLKILNNSKNVENKYAESNNQIYHVNSIPFKDVKNKEIGKIYVLNNVSEEYDFLYDLILNLSIIVFSLIFSMIIYYYLLIKKEEKDINIKENKIHSLAITDALTSIYNRRYFDSYSQTVLEKNKNNNLYLSMIIADIDNFKKYNDYYGHQEGDEILKTVANLIKNSLRRSNDKCFRLGGEEFGVIFESSKKEEGKLLAEKIRANIEKADIQHIHNENFGKITLSIGIYTVNSTLNQKMNTIYKNADKALYEAKKLGRNNVQNYKLH